MEKYFSLFFNNSTFIMERHRNCVIHIGRRSKINLNKYLNPVQFLKLMYGNVCFYTFSNQVMRLLRIYCLFLSGVMTYAFVDEIILRNTIRQVLWNGSCLIEYWCITISENLKPRRYYEFLFGKLETVLEILNCSEESFANMCKINVYLFVVLSFQIVMLVCSNFVVHHDNYVSYIITGLMLHFSIDVEYAWRIVFCYYVKFCLKYLRMVMCECVGMVQAGGETAVWMTKLKDCRDAYICIVDILDAVKSTKNTLVNVFLNINYA